MYCWLSSVNIFLIFEKTCIWSIMQLDTMKKAKIQLEDEEAT